MNHVIPRQQNTYFPQCLPAELRAIRDVFLANIHLMQLSPAQGSAALAAAGKRTTFIAR